MARRRYLIGYDIADEKRLRRVIKIMEAHGSRLQYSVFLCDLSGQEMVGWRLEMLDAVDLGEDSVITIDLGVSDVATPVRVLGKPRSLPASGAVVV